MSIVAMRSRGKRLSFWVKGHSLDTRRLETFIGLSPKSKFITVAPEWN